MGGLDVCRAFQIGDGPGDFQDTVVAAGGKAELVDGGFEEVAGGIGDGAQCFGVSI